MIEKSDLFAKCFHIFGEGRIPEYQGRVVGMANNDHFIVQFMSWIYGRPTTYQVLNIKDMCGKNWQFYEDADHMHEWFKEHFPKGFRK